MLNHIQAITKNIKGADPDDFSSERKWLKQRAERRDTVSKERRNNKAIKAKKIGNNSYVKSPKHGRCY